MSADINGDGVFTISDIWGWVEFILCWPGNTFLPLLGKTQLGIFFEINPQAEYTAGAWILSAIFWLVILGTLGRAVTEANR